MKIEFENIFIQGDRDFHFSIYRIKVINGWLVRTLSRDGNAYYHETMTFVPDKEHAWVIDECE